MHAPFLIVSLGLWVLAWSKGFTRLLPSLIFSIVLCVAAFFSPRETDNFLLLLGLCSLALGFGLSTLVRGQWQSEQVSHVKALIYGTLVVALSGAFILTQLRFTSPTGAAYYLTEASHQAGQVKLPWDHPKQLMGYLSYLFWGDGSVLSIPPNWLSFGCCFVAVLMGALVWLCHTNYFICSAKEELLLRQLLGFSVPLIPLALTHLPKKLAPIIAVAVAFIARPYWARAYPASPMGIEWSQHATLMGSPTWDGILQTSDQGLTHTLRLTAKGHHRANKPINAK